MPHFRVTVDLVVLTIREGRLCVVLVRRAIPPHMGQWALPGGFVLPGEDLGPAAYRELREETGIGAEVHLEQLSSYGTPGRDPRGDTVTVAWLALAPAVGVLAAGSDAAEAAWWPLDDLPTDSLAFDHAQILHDGVERARAKLEYTSLAAAFCPAEFTIGQLRGVYEAVWGQPLDPRNFHRKVSRTPGFLEPTGRTTTADGGRPAQLYRRGSLEQLNPPLTRSPADRSQ